MKLPGVGQVQTKYVWAGGAAVAGVVAYAWWHAGSSSNATPAVVDPLVDSAGLTGDPAGSGGYVNPAPAGAVADPTAGTAPTTNAEWSAAATDALERVGFDTAFIGSTLGKYLDRQPLTTAEGAAVRVAWAYVGRPPGGSYPIVTAPASANGSTPPPPAKPGFQYVTQIHQFAALTNSRGAVERFSDPAVATKERVQTALVATVNDPRNLRYRAFYASHKGYWPAQAKIYLHVVKVKS